jgi:hypothetical protein
MFGKRDVRPFLVGRQSSSVKGRMGGHPPMHMARQTESLAVWFGAPAR